MAASAAGMGPTPKVSRGIDAEASSRPKRRAREGSMRPEGSGRRLVRGMRASLSRSRTMFSTLAAATTIAVPATVSRASEAGTRTGASQRPVAAVKTTDAVIRGLVSSRYALPAEMASRGRIGVPRWEVQLARTMKGAVGGEAEHRRGLRPLRCSASPPTAPFIVRASWTSQRGTPMRPRDAISAGSAYLELTKPRITASVVFTAATGLWLAPVRVPASLALLTVAGTAMVVAAANVLNMVLERDSDALMPRTSRRPLPSGRIEPSRALLFGLLLASA